MNEIEALQGLRNVHINDTYKGQRLSLVLTNAIEALQEKQDRDNMRCENCEWFERERFFLDDEVPMSEQTIYTCTFYGDDVPDGIPVENNHFCSHYEPKEQVKSNE